MRYSALINVLILQPSGELSTPTFLFIDTFEGIIIHPDAAKQSDTDVVDCQGMILSPGLIDIQINGAFNVDLSDWRGDEEEYKGRLEEMCKALAKIGVTSFVPTLITQEPKVYQAVIPIIRAVAEERIGSPKPGMATPLGIHLEGPFISPKKPGCHPVGNLAESKRGIDDIDEMYGPQALTHRSLASLEAEGRKDPVTMVTIAPEIPGAFEAIKGMKERGVIVSLGHTDATHDQALGGIAHGATLITHLFNAMPPFRVIGLLGLPDESVPATPTLQDNLAHSVLPSPSITPVKSPLWSRAGSRIPSTVQEEDDIDIELSGEALRTIALADNPAALFAQIANLHGQDTEKMSTFRTVLPMSEKRSGTTDVAKIPDDRESEEGDNNDTLWRSQIVKRPFFSIIADGVHVHPQALSMAYNAHPEGCILVSDAMSLMDPSLLDGVYHWREGSKIEKKGGAIMLAGTDTLARSILPLAQGVRNLARFTSIPFHQALLCATLNPMKVLGGWVAQSKGMILEGYDADLCLWDHDGKLRRAWVAGKEVEGVAED
ncbi:hypothetical protein BD324DRAFT_651869 [Kockovaella imperatae]|uniref:Amidohydrolase-related domain-containing protein n=1 Tax=Kockovaella imperatae TaxID=4999 RepID=A0A1Y1UD46_9TREE|nr:hypothetical protein BD324DRAFT_651869 [Kockovaella imperatae]ORX35960.1 hypothetical protein BD324DRAFT_651869 [Kockovaella imperatae]